MCERCHHNEADSVHHLTYERQGRERLEDLQHVCFPCHQYIHGHIDEDPAYDSQFEPEPNIIDICSRCGQERDLVGRTGPQWFCEGCSFQLGTKGARNAG